METGTRLMGDDGWPYKGDEIGDMQKRILMLRMAGFSMTKKPWRYVVCADAPFS